MDVDVGDVNGGGPTSRRSNRETAIGVRLVRLQTEKRTVIPNQGGNMTNGNPKVVL